jgi:polysaccharide export outer membrane protein
MIVLCILIPGWLAAQTDAAKKANGPQAEMQTFAGDLSTGGTAARAHDDSYVIGTDDVLSINVWKEPEVSRTVPVRSDGKISLPLAGELQASGETPRQLARELAAKLQTFIFVTEVTFLVT